MRYYYDLESFPEMTLSASDNNYAGFSVIKLRDPLTNDYTQDTISFVGHRVSAVAPFTSGQYNEVVTLQTPKGMLVASTTYADGGAGVATSVPRVVYMIHNGNGVFINKTKLIIIYYNSTNPKKRVIIVK